MVDAKNIWEIVKANEGQVFYTVKGLPFTYTVEGDYLIPSRQRNKLPLHKSYFELTAVAMPKKLSDVPSNVMGPSYVYAIVKKIMNI